ncbi:MAG TPA: 2Fe-2S iron-sulfur cluster-binding protein [Syntrophorhabdaceae bacterium]|nr:(2Fe-2S)-binding protein [Syntrophorhabdaceae bacterium]MDD5007619.1 2Fe-2S iron-sulfur cluster-binding protein [Syntrophorhabdaceae bacterium]MDD5243463.1 2Fe-2S iron-sulfur cluster-binding protein [Syntrophorhabdaceae bacterium]HNS15700.1 2Fe-2S iron-sulfur cluster-binding protein [Syntrophorhabdaceae bacterium]HNT69062.1 2Fe-2S iron-sulfur cluster-binding protein [Syntrophorhabdaceae bacterium]
MINLTLNGLNVSVEEGTTLLEAANFYGFPIPTLCHKEGLTPYGACRLCVVEIGEGEGARLVSSCTYPAEEGLKVRTASERVIKARRMIIELLLASCPQSKTIQDIASQYNVRQQRFRQEYEDCILCGLCVRMCKEQMMANAIGFRGRGTNRSIGTPFDVRSDVCRLCGACMYICPACELRCTYTEPEKAICGGCANLSPPCLEKEQFHDMMCYMSPCAACEIKKD